MRTLKRLIAVVAALSLTLSAFATTAVANTTPPSDLRGHWAEKEVTALQEAGVILGYPDGTFRPDNPVTRAEFVTILNRAGRLDAATYQDTFADVNGS